MLPAMTPESRSPPFAVTANANMAPTTTPQTASHLRHHHDAGGGRLRPLPPLYLHHALMVAPIIATVTPTTISSATKGSLNPTAITVDPPPGATPVTGVKHIEPDPPTPAAATATPTTTTVFHPTPHSLIETPHQKHPTVSSEVLREAPQPQLRCSSLDTNLAAPVGCLLQHQTTIGMTYAPIRLPITNQVH